MRDWCEDVRRVFGRPRFERLLRGKLTVPCGSLYAFCIKCAPETIAVLGRVGRSAANSDRSTQRPESLTIATDRLPNKPRAS
jgi:hypothetical protein